MLCSWMRKIISIMKYGGCNCGFFRETHDVGAVGCLKNIKSAISVARHVMEYTEHTFLVGKDGWSLPLSLYI